MENLQNIQLCTEKALGSNIPFPTAEEFVKFYGTLTICASFSGKQCILLGTHQHRLHWSCRNSQQDPTERGATGRMAHGDLENPVPTKPVVCNVVKVNFPKPQQLYSDFLQQSEEHLFNKNKHHQATGEHWAF